MASFSRHITKQYDMPSSVVASMSYDAASSTLKIRFVSGLVYLYKNVPEKVFKAVQSAASKGTFLNTKIKGNYEFEKMKE